MACAFTALVMFPAPGSTSARQLTIEGNILLGRGGIGVSMGILVALLGGACVFGGRLD